MSRSKVKLILWLFPVVALVVTTGFLREFLFLNINEQISFVYYDTDFSRMSDKLWFLRSWDYSSLYYLKWTLTLVFTGIYLLEAALALKVLFRSFFFRELLFVFGALTLISGILYVAFSLAGDSQEGYLLARFFMGLAQSPVPLMLLIPAIFLRKSAA